MTNKRNLVLAAVAMTLSACGATPTSNANASVVLDGGTWTLQRLGDEDLTVLRKDHPVVLSFKDGRIQGQAPCNSISGNYTFEHGELTVPPLSRSKVYCADTAQLEQMFLDSLQATHRVSLSDQGLLLDGGALPMRFTRAALAP